jgi:RNA polymerase sigma-70 factor, ECF subfamily
MPPKQEDRSAVLEGYRSYLLMLARMQVSPKLRAKVAPSDLVQETLLRAVQGLAQFRGEGAALRAWLNGILAKVIAEAWRKNVAAKRSIDREEVIAKLEDSSGRLEAWLTAKGLAPDVQADRNEQLTDLARALEKLPEDQRDAVEFRYFHELSVKEVAKLMGKSVPAVAGLLRRGLEELRINMAGHIDGNAS